MPRSLRDIVNSISPSWKANGDFEKFDYSIMMFGDILLDKVSQAIAARIPTRTETTTSLPYIGADRLIPQGLVESTTAYAIRLQRAYDDWKKAGMARAVMAQVLGYLTPYNQRIVAVSQASVWDYFVNGSVPSDTPSHVPATAAVSPTANWDWDSVSDPNKVSWWWRTWLILDADPMYSSWTTTEGTWGDGDLWGDSTKSWGLSVPSTVISSIRAIAKLWKQKGTWIRWIIVSFDSTDYDPTAAPADASLPDGNWGSWSKITTISGYLRRIPSRKANSRYCDGTA